MEVKAVQTHSHVSYGTVRTGKGTDPIRNDDAAAGTRPSTSQYRPAISRLQTGLFYKKVGCKTYVSIMYLCYSNH